jgi:hypothetical protein
MADVVAMLKRYNNVIPAKAGIQCREIFNSLLLRF